jgi:hypothetical protein
MANVKTAVKTAELSTTINTIVSKLDDLSSARDTWEKTEYRTATESLYLLLSRTYAVYEDHFVNADDKDRVAMRKELSDKLSAQSIRVTKSSTTLSLLIRYVFKSDRQRVMRYRYAVEAAKSLSVKAVDLPAWLRENGGIDAVSKAAKASPESIVAKNELETAKLTVRAQIDDRKHQPLAYVQIPNFKSEKRCLLIAEPAIDGSFKIVEVVHEVSDAIYEQLIRTSARSKLKQKADLAETKREADMFSSKSPEQEQHVNLDIAA